MSQGAGAESRKTGAGEKRYRLPNTGKNNDNFIKKQIFHKIMYELRSLKAT